MISKFKMDVVFGLGFEGLGTITKPAFYKHIVGEKIASGLKKEFAFFLNADPGVLSKSTLTLCSIDPYCYPHSPFPR